MAVAPRWTNGPLVLYHGCDDASEGSITASILSMPPNGIDLAKCSLLTDFGQGFYTTTSLHEAKNWANQRCRVLFATSGTMPRATVIRFEVDRDMLAQLDFLGFVTENANSDFWNLVRECRSFVPPSQHRRKAGTNYDVVFGPVTLWPQILVIKDCDQVSFHTPQAIAGLPVHKIEVQGNPLFT